MTPGQRHEPIHAVGKVVASLANDVFRIQLDSGQIIMAHVPGGMRTRVVRILPGDRVRVEVSALDLTRGRVLEHLQQ